MTRPFLSLEECKGQAPAANDRPSQYTPQSLMMFVRPKLSRFEILPPVLCTRRVYIQVAFILLIGLIIFLVRMLSAMRVTFMQMHLESDTDGELVILPEEFAQARHAFCLDGSPPSYYYRQSSVPGAQNWIIFLRGGAWCSSPASCLERSTTYLGSSLNAETLLDFDGILSSDCTNNPQFCTWNMVCLHYCDGGSFLGNRSEPLMADDKKLYMRGNAVFDALIEYLLTHTMFRDAEHVILGGSSSGGLGALIHGDRMRQRLPSTVQSLHVVVDGSLFLDLPDINGDHTMRSILTEAFHFHHMADSGSMQRCTRTATKGEEFRCLLPENFYSYVTSPVYFINSLYDTYYRSCGLKINCGVDVCLQLNLRNVVDVREKLIKMGDSILKFPKNGVYLSPCPGHGSLRKPRFFSRLSQNRSAQSGVRDWFNRGSGSDRNLTQVLELSDALKVCPHAFPVLCHN